MEDLKRIPNHACSIEIDFDQLTVIEQSNADVQAERWCTIAQAPKWRIEPVLNVNFRRWANLKVLKLKSGPLPHYVTAWLPRLLENLDINHTLFTYSSYCNLPKQLLVLSLSGSGLLRPSFAAALPSSIRHLSTYTLKPKAYEKLPRELLTLEFIAMNTFLSTSINCLLLSLLSYFEESGGILIACRPQYALPISMKDRSSRNSRPLDLVVAR